LLYKREQGRSRAEIAAQAQLITAAVPVAHEWFKIERPRRSAVRTHDARVTKKRPILAVLLEK
jgi:hypothetical protein